MQALMKMPAAELEGLTPENALRLGRAREVLAFLIKSRD